MNCPDTTLLEQFTSDPEKLGGALEEFEAHISNCRQCQHKLELATRICELPNLLAAEHAEFETDGPLDNPPSIPGYTIESFAGRGGFGSVYRGRQNSTGRYVAIKIARNLNLSQLRRNQLEANVAAQLDHPHLVRLYDSGAVEQYSFTIFEWVDGSLSQRLAGSLIAPEQVVSWMLQLCQGVQFLHQLKIIHRDLKPSNILITANDQVKLTDFGIVKDLRDPSRTLTNSRAIGTPGFMSPEQVGLSEISVGPYTDVYGLGAVLYAMLVGHAPFVGGTVNAVLKQVVEREPYAPSKVRRDVPKDLEVICLKCLQKDHRDRYGSVEELSLDLQRFAEGMPIVARKASLPWRVWRAGQREPLVAGLSIAIFLLALLGVWLSTFVYRRDQARQSEVVAQTFCKIVVAASSENLSELYGHVDEFDRDTMRRSITTMWCDPQLNDSGRIRLLCLQPDQDIQRLTTERLVTALQKLDALEVQATVLKLRHCPMVTASDTVDTLRSMLEVNRSDTAYLPLVAMLATVDPDWSGWRDASERILRSLDSRPLDEAGHWSVVLKPLHSLLINHILAQSRSIPITEPEGFENQSTLPERSRSNHLESESVLRVVWAWAQNDEIAVVHLIKAMPPSKLAIVKSLVNEQRNRVLSHLRVEHKRLLDPIIDYQPQVLSGELSALLTQAGGLISGRGGFVTSLLQADTSKFIQQLANHGMVLTSIQPYKGRGQNLLAATFVKDLSLTLSNEQPSHDRQETANQEIATQETANQEAAQKTVVSRCDIAWSIERHELDAEVAERAKEGFYAEAFWLIPELPAHCVAVLWRPGKIASSRFVWSAEELGAANLVDMDSDQVETELLMQSVSEPIEETKTWCLGLIKQRSVASRDESTRRFVRAVDRPVGDCVLMAPTRWVEHLSGGDSHLSIDPTSPLAHAAQSQDLLKSGYEPLQICVDPINERIFSHWRYRQNGGDELERREITSLALAAWFLGDLDPVLDSIRFSHDPSLRTRVVEILGNIDQNASSFRRALLSDLSAAQLQGLLLALGNWNPDQLRFARDELVPLLKQLWLHNDSGVHFSADQLLRRLGIPEFKNIVRPDLIDSHGIAHVSSDRNWYYGTFGLPFAVVRPGVGVLGNDERIPWLWTIDRRVGTLSRTLAVCAIETPAWLMRRHIEESKEFYGNSPPPQINTGDGPVAGCKVEIVLRFCNWLGSKEGVTAEPIEIPLRKEGDDSGSGHLIQYDLTADGYRLPTNLEWEMCARAGTWSSNHLGNRFDFLSNYSWSSANCESHARPVGLLKPNPLGLFDILGNVYEFALGGSGVTGFPDNPETYEDFTLDSRTIVNVRGGAFLSSRIYCSSGASHHIPIKYGDVNTGFRVVRTLGSTVASR